MPLQHSNEDQSAALNFRQFIQELQAEDELLEISKVVVDPDLERPASV